MSNNNQEILDKITAARIRMLLHLPFFGSLATRLKIVDGSGWVNTAATDGAHFYYNVDFINSLDKKELEFLFGHECLHGVYDHMERRGSRDPQLWNMSADFVINLDLTEARCGKLIRREPKFEGDPDACIPCYDEKYKGMAADQVYELLKEEQQKNKNKKMEHQFDVHMDGEGQPEYDPTGFNGPIPMTGEEKEALKDEIQQAVMQAAKSAGVGNVPGGIRKMLTDLTDPQMDWREYLHITTQALAKYDYTFSKPNRRNSSLPGGIILPGFDDDFKVEVDCAIDTSGSMSNEMIKDMLSEVKGIMQQFSDYVVRVFCFDTDTYTMWKFNPDNVDELDNFEAEGGGGTAFGCIFDRLKKEEIVPQQLIVFTDAYVNDWGDSDYCETIFLVHSNPGFECPYGTTLEYTFKHE